MGTIRIDPAIPEIRRQSNATTHRRRDFTMAAELTINPANLKIYNPNQNICNLAASENPATPNEWFAQRYPEQIKKFGSPFIELHQPVDNFTVQILPVSINLDFFAGVLGGRRDLGHHNIYFVPEMQWYL
jgi:hypothetical protein